MKKLVAAIAVLAGLSTAALAQQDYPNRIIKHPAGLPAGRQRRHHRPHPRPRNGKEPRPVDRGRGQARPCRRARGRGHRAQRCRRLHAPDGAERASGLWRAVEERQIQGGGRLHLDFGRELLSVHDLREGGLALPDAQAVDRRGARQARRIEIRLRRRRLDPAHDGRVDRRPDQDQVPARSLSRRGAGHHRAAARRHRFHRRHHRADQRAREVGRVPGARGDRQDALARFPERADGR